MGKKKITNYILAGAVGLAAVIVLCILFYVKTAEKMDIVSNTGQNDANETEADSKQPLPLPEDDVIFTVDGYPVSRREFSLFIRDRRSDAAQYFYTEYGAEMNAEFWTAEFEGQTPSDYCKEKAVEELVRYKMERILASERGLVESVDYSDLMNDMDALNEKNKKGTEMGEIIYGLASFEPWQYLLYTRSDCDARLVKDEVKRCTESTPEETLRARYEEEKERYHKGYGVTYERLEASASASGDDLKTALGQVAGWALEKGESLEASAAALMVLDEYSVKQETNIEISVGKDDFWEQYVQEEVRKLEPGTISEPLLSSDISGCLLRGIERTDLGYDSFEDVKLSMIYEYAQETLQAELEERIKNAFVVFDNEKYDQITVE